MSYLQTTFTKIESLQVIRFVIVGTINTSFSFFIYATVLFFGFGYQLANLVALIIGILFSFKTQGHLVFDNPDNRLLGRFILSWVVIYFCTITIIGQIISFGFNPYSAGALSLPFSVALSYLAQKHFVFRKSTTEKSGINNI